MTDAVTRFASLRVADAMSNNALVVDANASMLQAAHFLRNHDHSAAPAVDEQGRCVGVLSATDFLKRECRTSSSWFGGEACETVRAPEESLRVDTPSTDNVRDYMSRTVQTVSPSTSLMKAIDIMRGMYVHRLPVLDANGRPVGMISSMDIISAVMNVMDELNVEQINRARQ